jgi:adenine/guanine phosphoribosyltransferase-like PRPP-binding protein
LYYPTAHLAKAVATELDLDLLDCLRWAGGKSESQKKRRGVLKLKRLGEFVECTSDLTDLRVLLIDDILTTGLTASKCVEALTFAGAEDVFVAVLGWTVSEAKTFVSKGLKKQCLKKTPLARGQGRRWEIQTHSNTENIPILTGKVRKRG